MQILALLVPSVALWGPLGLLSAFWLGPKGGRWLCQTPFINTQSILVVCGQFRPTGDVRKVKKANFCCFCRLLELPGAPFGLLVGSKGWQMVESVTLYKCTPNTGLILHV